MPAKISDFETIFGNIIKAAIGFGAIALFCMLLIGGFGYLNSGGDPKHVEAAQKTITYALVGLVLILLSYLMLLLISTLTGVDVTKFKIML